MPRSPRQPKSGYPRWLGDFGIRLLGLLRQSLRNREGDIRLLAGHYLEHYARLLDKPARGFTEPILDRLEAYVWPGNVRELQNVIERMVHFSDGELIGSDMELPGRAPAEAAGTAAAGAPAEVTSLADLEREAVSHALCVARYNVSRAAEMLDVTKPRLYRMIRRHGIRLQRTGRKASGFGG